MSVLSETECWRLLADAGLGRLVTDVDGRPAIFPVNFAVQNRTVLFRTAEGTKLVGAAINNNVLFEADGPSSIEGWSVMSRASHAPCAATRRLPKPKRLTSFRG